MKFGITINVGNYNSLRCESTDHETIKECYEEVLSIISDWDNFDSITWWMDKLREKIQAMLSTKSQEIVIKEIKVETIEKEAASNFAMPITGEFQWYKLADQEGKLRRCNNAGCDLFLKYNKDKKTYEHWKYDANTGKGGFVQDKCDYFGGS